jgi:hypothetical protein
MPRPINPRYMADPQLLLRLWTNLFGDDAVAPDFDELVTMLDKFILVHYLNETVMYYAQLHGDDDTYQPYCLEETDRVKAFPVPIGEPGQTLNTTAFDCFRICFFAGRPRSRRRQP